MADWAGIRVRRELYERVAARAAADGVSVAEFAASVLEVAVGGAVVGPVAVAAPVTRRPPVRRSVKPPAQTVERVAAETRSFVRASGVRPAHAPTCKCGVCRPPKPAKS